MYHKKERISPNVMYNNLTLISNTKTYVLYIHTMYIIRTYTLQKQPVEEKQTSTNPQIPNSLLESSDYILYLNACFGKSRI